MMELATNTIKADSTIGSQRVVRKAMCNLLRVWAQLRDFHVRLTRLLDAVKRVHFACRCSKIMSPHNCNQTLSPCKDGDHESERVPTGESDRECGGRAAERTRSRPPAATE